MTLKRELEIVINKYTEAFCKKQECYADGWIANDNLGINCFADCYLSINDIVLDIDSKAPKGEIFKWYWDNIDAEKFINYNSYLMGLRNK